MILQEEKQSWKDFWEVERLTNRVYHLAERGAITAGESGVNGAKSCILGISWNYFKNFKSSFVYCDSMKILDID
jgi:hypothetical protein